MRFGLFVPQGWRLDLAGIDTADHWATMLGVAKAAEDGPFESVWVFDHFHTVPVPTQEATHEAWTLMAGLAAATSRVRLGQMCTCMGYRNPAYLAKVAATVDVISGGRAEMGIGAGWYEHEWRAYGYGFPELKERMGMFKEACEIIHRMWTEDYPVFKGTYYAIDRPINEPKGVQKPHPPLWIGGSGERVTLKLVAQFGDACNVGGDPDTIRHKLGVLRQHCETVGRNYDDIIKSAEAEVLVIGRGDDPERTRAKARSYEGFREGTLIADADRVTEYLRTLIEAGIDYFIIYIPGVAYDLEPLHRFETEVIPQLAGATPVHSTTG